VDGTFGLLTWTLTHDLNYMKTLLISCNKPWRYVGSLARKQTRCRHQ